MLHDPQRALRDEFPAWRVVVARHLPGGTLGMTRWQDRTVWILAGLTQVEWRCVLEHERQHIIHGKESCDTNGEIIVNDATARMLLPFDVLLDALRWSRHPHEVADHCMVTLDVLMHRMARLHPSESFLFADL